MNFASAADVTSALTRVAAASRLLVVSDFDGTIADFSTDPYNVPVNARSISALQELAALPRTDSAILSGRHLEGLAQVSGSPEGIVLAGSHGADAYELKPTEAEALTTVTSELEKLIDGVDGAFLEHKPFNCVLHYREASAADQAKLIDAATNLHVPGTHPIHGKCIIEYSVVDITKGTWITNARDSYRADSIIFLGDDFTDENALKALGPHDLGIRVGEGDTVAHLRIEDTRAVADLLEELVQLRGAATVEPA